ERCIKGEEHRLLVVGGQVVAAARGETAWVKGDGKSTVAQLVDAQINSDTRRGTTEAHPLNVLSVYDDTAIVNELARQGLAADAVPAADRMVLIQRNGNVAYEVTDQVCEDVAEMAALAARVVGLDIAGVDLVAEDISRPLAEQGGAIVEVNAGPGLLMHLKPANGEPRPVGRAIVDHLFPGEDSGRIPIVGITGSEHGSVISRLVAWLLHLSGLHVGVACGDGLYLDRRCVESGNRATWDAGERVLMNRMVEAAVFENGAEVILGQGLAYDRCHIGIVTDMNGLDKLEQYDIRDRDQLYTVVRTQIDVVMSDGAAVLNADDEDVAGLADLSDGVVILYGLDANGAVLAKHRAEGGRAVTVVNGAVVLQEGEQSQRVMDLARVPCENGVPLLPTAALLPAIAAAWVMNIDPSGIEIAVESFAAHLLGPVTTAKKSASKNTATGKTA
ncbi:MAG: cyanophycin synthetase, partial [Burkholderiales bacterium]|nr:cyanophycin synthetase [Burkholderiales bacterium]